MTTDLMYFQVPGAGRGSSHRGQVVPGRLRLGLCDLGQHGRGAAVQAELQRRHRQEGHAGDWAAEVKLYRCKSQVILLVYCLQLRL